jgi:hypothetical protein
MPNNTMHAMHVYSLYVIREEMLSFTKRIFTEEIFTKDFVTIVTTNHYAQS